MVKTKNNDRNQTTKLMIHNIEEKFNANQKDLILDPVKVLWTGQTISLFAVQIDGKLGKFLTSFSAERGVSKIKAWCVKNSYRCPQVVGAMIMI